MKKKVLLKVISGLSMCMFTAGFITHAYMSEKGIDLVNTNAYAMSASGEALINYAQNYEGYTNEDIVNEGKKLCQSAWCASWVTLMLNDLCIYNPVPDDAAIRVEEYVKSYIDEGRFHLCANANSEAFTTKWTGSFVSSEELEATRVDPSFVPEMGDIILFQWDDGEPDHIGFFISQSDGIITTIEGNPGDAEWWETHVTTLTHYANSEYIYGYIHPHYCEETEEERLQREIKEREEVELNEITQTVVEESKSVFDILFKNKNDEFITITFDAMSGTVSESERKIIRNTCSINEFPEAMPNDKNMKFVKWVDNTGETYTHNSIIDHDLHLYAVYEYNESIVTESSVLVSDVINQANENCKEYTDDSIEINITAPSYNSPLYINDEIPNENEIETSSESTYILGDINGDNIVDARDATTVLSYYAKISAGEDEITNKMLEIADANGDDLVNIIDAQLILEFYTISSSDSFKNITFEEYIKSKN